LSIGGRKYRLGRLRDIARITRGQKISYATDIAMTGANIKKLADLVKASDTFYCEAYFLEEDRQRAIERFHLTARTTGSIARMAAVAKLSLMHLSPKYRDCPEKVLREAMDEFKRKK
jgi:ribonuclease Z